MDKLFYNISQRIAAQKPLSIGVLLALIIGLFFLASNIEFEEDITKLIPQSKKFSEAQKVLKQVNFADKIIINIQRKENGNVDDLTQYATAFIDSISNSSEAFYKRYSRASCR